MYVFYRTDDVRKMIMSIERRFQAMNLEVKVVEFVKPYDKEMEWDTIENAKHFGDLYKQSIAVDELVLDGFYAYEK